MGLPKLKKKTSEGGESYFTQKGIAFTYDDYIRKSIPFYDAALRHIKSTVKNLMRDRDDLHYADIGTGTGNVAAEVLASGLDFASCQLLDHSAPMLEVAGEKLLAAVPGSIQLHKVNSSFMDADLSRELVVKPVDIMTSMLTLDHIPYDDTMRSLFHQVASSVRTGGLFVVGEKCANESGESISVYLKMIELRIQHMFEHKLKTIEEIEDWKNHILTEDHLRPLPTLLTMLEDAGFAFAAAAGAELPVSVDELTYEKFHGLTTLAEMERKEVMSAVDQAFGIGIIVCRKR